MTVADFIDKSKKRYGRHGLRAVPGIASEFTAEAVSRAVPFHRYGRRIFEYDWDVLVVLDACRADMYRRVVNPEADRVWSCAGTSHEWLAKNFHEEYADEMARTAYVTGNPFSRDRFDTRSVDDTCGELGLLDEVWRYAWDDDRGTIPARPLTDRAVTTCRREEYDRVVVHYMQPHFPFIGSDETWGRMHVENFGAGGEDNIWYKAMMGEVDPDDIWKAYDENLEYVWEEVGILRENVDGRLVVTADHGNAIGQWGMWGHRARVPAPSLRWVPWDEYDCTDQGSHEPATYEREDVADDAVDERLEDLGYL